VTAQLGPIELEVKTPLAASAALSSLLAKAEVWLPGAPAASYNLWVWPRSRVTTGFLPAAVLCSEGAAAALDGAAAGREAGPCSGPVSHWAALGDA